MERETHTGVVPSGMWQQARHRRWLRSIGLLTTSFQTPAPSPTGLSCLARKNI